MSPDRPGLGFAALAAVLWGLAGLWIRLLPGAALSTVLFGRLGLAIVAVAPFVWMQRRALGRPTRAAWGLAAAMVAYYACSVAAFQLAPVAEVALLVNLSPALAVAVALASGERLSRGERWGTALALAGVAVIFAPALVAPAATGGSRLAGDACALGAAAVMAGYATAFRRLGAAGPLPLVVTALTFGLGAVGLASVALIRGPVAFVGIGWPGGWAVLGALAVVSTAVPTFAFSAASQRLAPVLATGLRLLTPPCAALAAWAVLGEVPAASVVPGGALILSGLALALRKPQGVENGA